MPALGKAGFAAYIHDMKPNNPLFEDALSLFNSGVGFVTELREQIMNDLRARMDDKIDRLNLAKREDVDRLETLIKDLRAEIDALKAQQK